MEYSTFNKVAVVSAAVFALGILAVTMMWSAPVTAQDTKAYTIEERLAKNKEYRAGADVIFPQIFEEQSKLAEYKEQRENASSDAEKQELDAKIQASEELIKELKQKLGDLESLNKSLYTEELQEKVYGAKHVLWDKYMDENSDTYIGENPVEIIEANILAESVTLVVNPDKVAEDRSNVPDETSVNGVAVEIRYGKTELLS